MSSLTQPAPAAVAPDWLDLVRRKVEGLRYGQVYIVVHDQQVTQIECLEKTRLPSSRPASARHPEAD